MSNWLNGKEWCLAESGAAPVYTVPSVMPRWPDGGLSQEHAITFIRDVVIWSRENLYTKACIVSPWETVLTHDELARTVGDIGIDDFHPHRMAILDGAYGVWIAWRPEYGRWLLSYATPPLAGSASTLDAIPISAESVLVELERAPRPPAVGEFGKLGKGAAEEYARAVIKYGRGRLYAAPDKALAADRLRRYLRTYLNAHVTNAVNALTGQGSAEAVKYLSCSVLFNYGRVVRDVAANVEVFWAPLDEDWEVRQL